MRQTRQCSIPRYNGLFSNLNANEGFTTFENYNKMNEKSFFVFFLFFNSDRIFKIFNNKKLLWPNNQIDHIRFDFQNILLETYLMYYFLSLLGSDDRSNHLQNLLWQYQNNRSISSDAVHYVILSIYILICVVAIFANSLIVWAVIRNKKVNSNYHIMKIENAL